VYIVFRRQIVQIHQYSRMQLIRVAYVIKDARIKYIAIK